jgi:hypothetical protein
MIRPPSDPSEHSANLGKIPSHTTLTKTRLHPFAVDVKRDTSTELQVGNIVHLLQHSSAVDTPSPANQSLPQIKTKGPRRS